MNYAAIRESYKMLDEVVNRLSKHKITFGGMFHVFDDGSRIYTSVRINRRAANPKPIIPGFTEGPPSTELVSITPFEGVDGPSLVIEIYDNCNGWNTGTLIDRVYATVDSAIEIALGLNPNH